MGRTIHLTVKSRADDCHHLKALTA